MPSPNPGTRYHIVGGAVVTTLKFDINAAAMSFQINATTGWPDGSTGPFWVAGDQGLGAFEKILCSARSGDTVTVASSGRGVDGTTAHDHTANSGEWYPVVAAGILDPINEHVASTSAVHGVAGAVVGTSDSQTISNKTINTSSIASPTISGTVAGGASYTSVTLTTPTIASFVNATHNHSNAAGGGNLTVSDFTNMAHDHGDADDGGGLATGITLTAPTIADFTNAAHDHGDADDGGALVASITLTTPTIASFTNATHTHSNAAGGGSALSPATVSATGQITHNNGFVVPREALIIKTANQTYTSDATLNDDTELTLPVAANTRYAFTAWINYFGPSAADFQWLFTAPAGAAAQGVVSSSEEADAVNSRDLLGGAGAYTVGTSGGTGVNSDGMTITGHVTTAGTAGDLLFRHAQGVSNAGTTGVREGSWMRLSRA